MPTYTSMSRFRAIALACLAGLVAHAQPAQARIIKIEITKTIPAFEGKVFGAVGAYEHITGKAYGAVDPKASGNVIIQDIELAPKNAAGLVEYVTDIELIRPADASKGNGVLLVEVVNRGNRLALRNFNTGMSANPADWNALKGSGDGFLMNQGYTVIWFGWQADLIAGNNRIRLVTPVAKNADGTSITGVVRSEMVVNAPAKTLPLSNGWFTSTTHHAYPTVSADNRTALADGFLPTLTVRAKENAPRVRSEERRVGKEC